MCQSEFIEIIPFFCLRKIQSSQCDLKKYLFWSSNLIWYYKEKIDRCFQNCLQLQYFFSKNYGRGLKLFEN